MQFLNDHHNHHNHQNHQNQTKPTIIVCCIPPPIDQAHSEKFNGQNAHNPFPFVGTNEERAFYTETMNKALQQGCLQRGFHFFDYYDDFVGKNDDNSTIRLLDVAISDNICHIQQNQKLLDKFSKNYSDFLV